MDLLATALPALGQAMTLIFEPERLVFLVMGVLLGLSVGVFPGLGGIAGLSLVLPFIYGMDPVSGLAMMVGLVAVIPTSDTFASVLMGIPGSSASQATVLDGFPLSRSGHAARALSAAFVSSLFGGLLAGRKPMQGNVHADAGMFDREHRRGAVASWVQPKNANSAVYFECLIEAFGVNFNDTTRWLIAFHASNPPVACLSV